MNQHKEKKIVSKKKENKSIDPKNSKKKKDTSSKKDNNQINITKKKMTIAKNSKLSELNNKKKKDTSSKLIKSVNKKYKMIGAGDIIGASIDMIDRMTDLGNSIFGEIASIQKIPQDINNVASVKSVPNNNLTVPK